MEHKIMGSRALGHGVQFLEGVLKSRWMMLVACFFVMSSAGGLYAFGLYSQELKLALQYDQATVNNIAFFKDLGANFGILSGIVFDFSGAWLCLLLGSLVNTFGYTMVWLAVTKRIARPAVWQMCLYMAIGANSGSLASTAAIVSGVKTFPQNRGMVIGLVKAFTGLSGAMMTQLFRAIYGRTNSTSSFILLLGWFPSFVYIVLMFIVRPIKPVGGDNDRRNLFVFLGMAITLAVYLMIIIIIHSLCKVSRKVDEGLAAIMIAIMLIPLGLVVQAEYAKLKQEDAENAIDQTCSASLQEQGSYQSSIKATDDPKVPLHTAPDRTRPPNIPVHTARDGIGSQNVPVHTPTEGIKTINFPVHTGTNSVHTPTDEKSTQNVPAHTSTDWASTQKASVHTVREEMSGEKASTKTGAEDEIKKPLAAPSPGKHPSSSMTPSHRWKTFITELKFKPNRGEDHTVLQAIASVDFLLLFVLATGGFGTGQMVVDNLGQLGASLGYTPITVSTFVSLVSIWNFCGRVGFGFTSEILMQKHGIPRPLFYSVVCAISTIVCVLVAADARGSMYVGSILIGISFGAQLPLLYSMISEIFGLKFFGTLYNVGTLAIPIGTYLLSVRTAGHLYDREAARQRQRGTASSSGLLCHGAVCYRTTFLILAGVSVFGCFLGLVLGYRTRHFYKKQKVQKTAGD